MRASFLLPMLTGCFVTNADLRGRLDMDGDGFFVVGALGDDCDDTNSSINPDAFEVPYNGIDEDCDGPEDDGDADGDGFSREIDCDDSDPDIRPDALEIHYDGVDQDCDGSDDYDQDGDGAYDEDSPPPGLTLTPENTDCDDTDPEVFGVEIPCDDVDNDCDPGTPDGGLLADDADGDGTPFCSDCDDTDPTVDLFHQVFYLDADGDGFGNPDTALESCRVPVGYILEDGDCDDLVFAVHPDAAEICNGIDDDCSGHIDDASQIQISAYYPDLDGDGFGDGTEPAVESCLVIAGASTQPTDCDDEDPSVSPVGVEFCGDGLDSDCDHALDDEDAVGMALYHPDSDGDGAGDPGSDAVLLCSSEDTTGFSSNDFDCDVGRPDRWRGPEVGGLDVHDLGDDPTPLQISGAFSETCEGAVLQFGGSVEITGTPDGLGFPLRLGGSSAQFLRPHVTLRGRDGATVHSDNRGVMVILEEGCVACTVEDIAFQATAPQTAFARVEVENPELSGHADASAAVTLRRIEVRGFDSRHPGLSLVGDRTSLTLQDVDFHDLTLGDHAAPGNELSAHPGVVVVGAHSGPSRHVAITHASFRNIDSIHSAVDGAIIVNRSGTVQGVPSTLSVSHTIFAGALTKGIRMEDATGKLDLHNPPMSLHIQDSLFHDLAGYAVEVLDPDGPAVGAGDNSVTFTDNTVSRAPGLVADLAPPGMVVSNTVMHVGPLGTGDPPTDFFSGVPAVNVANCAQSVLPTSVATPVPGTLDPHTGCVESGGPDVLFIDPSLGSDGLPVDLGILQLPPGTGAPLGYPQP